jgi:hypothetical protein
MKKTREYWVMGWFLMGLGLFWIVEAFWPVLPWAAITTSKNREPVLFNCVVTALPGVAAVIVASGFWRKARRMNQPSLRD